MMMMNVQRRRATATRRRSSRRATCSRRRGKGCGTTGRRAAASTWSAASAPSPRPFGFGSWTGPCRPSRGRRGAAPPSCSPPPPSPPSPTALPAPSTSSISSE
ncbi:unnamed protein product [Linum tenue]|uniref:Uncharacterized protein n=1 Tax=Linum tenue TaxID=586396 RepID=A0AAV0K5U5_9ROSI|nr:unnamed protein product [Linum tenue]